MSIFVCFIQYLRYLMHINEVLLYFELLLSVSSPSCIPFLSSFVPRQYTRELNCSSVFMVVCLLSHFWPYFLSVFPGLFGFMSVFSSLFGFMSVFSGIFGSMSVFSGLFGFMSVFSSFRLITNSFLLSVYFLSFVGLIVLWFLSDFCVFRLIPVWFLSDFWLISDWFLYDICLILSYFYLSDSVLSLSDNCNCSVSLISFFLSAFCQVWSRFCLVPVYFLPFLSNFFLVFLSLIFKFFFFPSYFVDLKFMKIIFFFETFNL